jgi:hypothetical protein
MTKSHGRVVGLGFNRPHSRIGELIKRQLDTQSGPAMLSWFVVGHDIPPNHWYFREEEGGRVLGNLCHWTDFIYHMIAPENRYPITIRPTRGEKADCDIAVTYTFGDGTLAVITFSEKGHTFEGVREHFAAHRGHLLVAMDDFQYLTLERVDKKHRLSLRFRDHGHERVIKRSYDTARMQEQYTGCSIQYVWEAGELFLKTKQSLEENRDIIVRSFEDSGHAQTCVDDMPH